MNQKCNQCQAMVNDDSLVVFGDDSVCQACKPRYIQRLKEGVDPSESELTRPHKSSWGFKIAFGLSLLISIACSAGAWPEAIFWSNTKNHKWNTLNVFTHPLGMIWLWGIAFHSIFMLLAMRRSRIPVYVAMLLPLYTVFFMIWEAFSRYQNFYFMAYWVISAIICLYEATLFGRLQQLKRIEQADAGSVEPNP